MENKIKGVVKEDRDLKEKVTAELNIDEDKPIWTVLASDTLEEKKDFPRETNKKD